MHEVVFEAGGFLHGSAGPALRLDTVILVALNALALRWTRLPGIRRRDPAHNEQEAASGVIP